MSLLANNRTSGQALSEFLIYTIVLFVPFVGLGVHWIQDEWTKAECALTSFKMARQKLIHGQQSIHEVFQCGKFSESIHLLSAEDLDTDKGALDFGDLKAEIDEASRSLEQSLDSLRSLARSELQKSCGTSTGRSKPKCNSIDAPPRPSSE